jgi:membrane protein DedA with SNARE-associated domain
MSALLHALLSLVPAGIDPALASVWQFGERSLTHLERLWTYATLGATAIITEEANPLIGGLAARARHLSFAGVSIAVATGSWIADIGLYYLGRWRGDWVRRRWPNARAFLLRALRLVRRHPWRSSLAVRYAFGLRLTLPVACGAARIPLWLYVVGSGISAVSWSLLFTLIGWGFGEAALRLLGHLRRYEKWIALGIVVGLIVMYFVMRRRHVADEVVEVLGSGDEDEFK